MYERYEVQVDYTGLTPIQWDTEILTESLVKAQNVAWRLVKSLSVVVRILDHATGKTVFEKSYLEVF